MKEAISSKTTISQGAQMSINYIGSGGLSQIENLKTNTGVQNTKEAGKLKDVEFSSVLQGTKESASPGDLQRAERAQKIAAIKEQVEAGSYQPDLERVAKSLATFLLDGE